MPVIDESRMALTTSVSWNRPPNKGGSPDTWYTERLEREKVFQKPDPVHTPLVNGWRKPLAYRFSDIDRKVWSGTSVFVGYYWENLKPVNFPQRFDEGPVGESHQNPIFTPLPSVAPTVPFNMINRTEIEALLKAKDQYMQLGASLAEGKKTVSMVSDTIVSLYSALKALRRGDLQGVAKALSIRHKWASVPPDVGGIFTKGLKKSTREAAGRWLEVQYGWMPLLSDLKAAYDAMAGDAFEDKEPSFFVTKRRKESVSSNLRQFSYANWNVTVDQVVEFECFVRLDYMLEVTALRKLDRLGLLNPVSVAWELVPFSFVVDWLVPIGDLLTALGPEPGLIFRGGSRTDYTRATYTGKASVIETDPAKLTPGATCGGAQDSKSVVVKMTRTAYERAPIPLPYYKNPFSVGHGLNALALIRQLLK